MAETTPRVRYFRSTALPWRRDASGARFWAAGLSHVALTYFRLDPHTRFEAHSHLSEQITLVLSGTLVFEVSGAVYEVGPGEVIAIPGHVEHAVFSKDQPVEAVDAWSPPPEHLGDAPSSN